MWENKKGHAKDPTTAGTSLVASLMYSWIKSYLGVNFSVNHFPMGFSLYCQCEDKRGVDMEAEGISFHYSFASVLFESLIKNRKVLVLLNT